jgi:adenosine deaminase
LSLDEVVEAVLAGFRRGAEGRPITMGLLLSAMRQAARSVEIAELAVRHRDHGVLASTWPAPRPATRQPAISTRST